MATRILDRVPVDSIKDEARQVHLGRALLTLLVGVFWLLGWLLGMGSLAVRIVWAAGSQGWQDARRPFLEAEVERGRRPA